MRNVIYLTMRRLRTPVITVICAYAISIIGLVLIPGIDDQGNPWRMDFFHAFYFISYTGSTIGFGELPYPFTDAQRMWVSFTIYITVVAWLYTIGAILAIVQDKAFRRVVSRNSFRRSIRRIGQPFYLICGYGDAGSIIVDELANKGIFSTVVDIDPDRIDTLKVDDLPIFIPGLCANPIDPEILLDAGLTHPLCQGVVAVTSNELVNLKIAISSKLLRPEMQVITRVETRDTEDNMASFGTDTIINPYETFARRFGMMFNSPTTHLIYEWITSLHYTLLEEFQSPPKGTWILCGYGRFGKAVCKYLSAEGVEPIVIEADPHGTLPPKGAIIGRGTEAVTLLQAGIKDAVGIIAGTDDDTNNLSIILTARDLNPKLFTVARQNLSRNDVIFAAAKLDVIMEASASIGRRVVARILTPMLGEFLALARNQDESWANILISRISGVVSERSAGTWTVELNPEQAPAVCELFSKGISVDIARLTTNPHDHEDQLSCLPLLLMRDSGSILLPTPETRVEYGDRILMCGKHDVESSMRFTMTNYNVMDYVCTGVSRPSGSIWRWLSAETDTSKQKG